MTDMQDACRKNAEAMAALDAMADHMIDGQGFIGWQDDEGRERMFLVRVQNPFAFAQVVYDAVARHEKGKRP